jgi:hypothetical protein
MPWRDRKVLHRESNAVRQTDRNMEKRHCVVIHIVAAPGSAEGPNQAKIYYLHYMDDCITH